jgi:hypothetical protein
MRTIYNQVFARAAVSPVAHATGTLQGTSIDRCDPTGGYNSTTNAMFVVHCGVITDGTHTVTVEESGNNSDWTTADASVVLGTAPAIVAADDQKVFEFGYVGSARYIRLKVVTADGATGGVFGATCILGNGGSVAR